MLAQFAGTEIEFEDGKTPNSSSWIASLLSHAVVKSSTVFAAV